MREKKTQAKIKLTRKFHELRYQSNEEILESLDDIKALIQAGSSKRLINKMSELTAKDENRNKVIKMADRSTAGWAVVEEYLS